LQTEKGGIAVVERDGYEVSNAAFTLVDADNEVASSRVGKCDNVGSKAEAAVPVRREFALVIEGV